MCTIADLNPLADKIVRIERTEVLRLLDVCVDERCRENKLVFFGVTRHEQIL